MLHLHAQNDRLKNTPRFRLRLQPGQKLATTNDHALVNGLPVTGSLSTPTTALHAREARIESPHTRLPINAITVSTTFRTLKAFPGYPTNTPCTPENVCQQKRAGERWKRLYPTARKRSQQNRGSHLNRSVPFTCGKGGGGGRDPPRTHARTHTHERTHTRTHARTHLRHYLYTTVCWNCA